MSSSPALRVQPLTLDPCAYRTSCTHGTTLAAIPALKLAVCLAPACRESLTYADISAFPQLALALARLSHGRRLRHCTSSHSRTASLGAAAE